MTLIKDYKIIGSSSKGNCIIVQKILMLDAGVTYKIIFVSHMHKDHLLPSTIKQMTYNHPTLKYLTGSRGVVRKLYENGVKQNQIIFLKPGKWYDLSLLKVKLVQLYHDVENCGLKWQINGLKGIYIVDTNNVEGIIAKNYDLYLIENNYQDEIINEHLNQAIEENDDNKIYYLKRTMATHLSKSKCDSFLIENMGSNSVFDYVHLSKYNNTENGELE